jgi:hypothetical protein
MEVEIRRNFPWRMLEIEFTDLGEEGMIYVIEDSFIEKRIEECLKIENRYAKIEDAFPEMLESLKEICKNREELDEVKDWFFQDLDALLKPLSY